MRLLHIADLHLGRDFYRFSLKEEQRAVLEQILHIADGKGADALLLAGDIFDRSPAPQEALRLYDDFITEAIRLGLSVFAIPGNHDSSVRLGVGRHLLAQAGYYLETETQKELRSRLLEVRGERLRIFQMPYLRKSRLRSFYPESETKDFSRLMADYLRDSLPEKKEEYWLLLAHQWVSCQGEQSLLSESESELIGTVEMLPLSLFERFDYLALGHLHRPQRVGEKGAYAGSPLNYSVSELAVPKTVPLLELRDGQLRVEKIPLQQPRGLRVLRGSLETILAGEAGDDFVIAELEGKAYPQEAMQRLRGHFPYLCQIRFRREEEALSRCELELARQQNFSPLQMFRDFFRENSGHAMTELQEGLCRELLTEEEETGV